MITIDIDRLASKSFFVSLAGVTIVYFAAIRLFQDWLYRVMGIDARPADMFLSFGPKFSQAEPFEIILYLLGYVVIPVAAYVAMPLFERVLDRIHISKRQLMFFGVCFTGVAVGFLILKFPFERAIEYIQTNTVGHVLWFVATKRIIVTWTLLAMSAVFFIIHYFWLGRSYSLSEASTKSKSIGTWDKKLSFDNTQEITFDKFERLTRRSLPILLILLAFLIFNPSFPIDAHHSNYFVGSVHEVYQGKALLYESSNLYGLFSIYFLLVVFQFIPLAFTSLTALIMVVYLLFFSALWVFVRRWLGSYTLATVTLVPIIAIMYLFQTSPTRSALFLPAMSPFRWGMYVVVLFLMLAFERTKKNTYLRWSLFVSAFSLFWNFDSGLFLSAATLGTVGYISLCHSVLDTESKQKNKNKKTVIANGRERSVAISLGTNNEIASQSLAMTIKEVLKIVIEYVGYVLGLFITTSIINKLVYGAWPHWELFFRESKYFSTGIAMYPLPKFGVFEILFLVYATVIVLAFVRLMKCDEVKSFNVPLLFLALYGVFSFIYYIGESSWQILYVVVVPFVLICGYAYRQVQMKRVSIEYLRVIRSGFATIVFFGFALLVFKLPVEFTVRNYSDIAERFTSVDPLDQGTYDDAQYLKTQYPQHRISIMSLNDTKLMMYSGKVNAFDFYYIFTIYFRSEMQKYIDLVLREQPKYIIVGTGKYRNDQVEYFLDGIKDRYALKESLGTVEIHQLKSFE